MERETKNTVRFAEQAELGAPPVVGTLYVAKWALPAGTKTLRVTLEADGE